MSSKTSIIDDLGESSLLLPQRIGAALAANDRLKVCFSILQAAERHADQPSVAPPDLSAEQRAVGLNGDLDRAISGSRREPDGSLCVPGAAQLRQTLLGDLTTMRTPLALAHVPDTERFEERERSLIQTLPEFIDDRIPVDVVGAITSVPRVRDGASDSVHLLVMDLHKAINALQATVAQETIEGARCWQIEEGDRTLIRAFMTGLQETAPLKFDHPGLGTTATRVGSQLVIQNDIGTTDAHVLVLRVQGLEATLTYTDVHARRLAFFQGLFKPFGVRWSDPVSRRNEAFAEQAEYSMSVGRFQAEDPRALERYLAFLGSQIVFLIDWNRARKQLREFLPKAEAIRLLKWAAEDKIGQRGFLQLGGAPLVYEALEFVRPSRMRYGERLDEALGTEATFSYLQFVFRQATLGLLQNRSERFIRDEIKAELARCFRSAHAGLLAIALTHAERVFDLAVGVRDGLACYGYADSGQTLQRNARRARVWEQECDAIVVRMRSLSQRTSNPRMYADLMHEADEAADGLEEAAFLMTHLAGVAPAAKLVEPVENLATLLVAGSQETVKMYEAASHVTRAGAREDVQDFLAAVERIVAIEHNTDTAQRVITTALLTNASDAPTLQLLWNLTRVLEEAADALSLSALMLRDYLLNEIAKE